MASWSLENWKGLPLWRCKEGSIITKDTHYGRLVSVFSLVVDADQDDSVLCNDLNFRHDYGKYLSLLSRKKTNFYLY